MRALIVLALCLSVALADRPKVVAPQQSDCSICEFVVGQIEAYIENNDTIAEIEKQLEQFCALFPSLTATCDAIVEQGVPQIVQWIEQNATPTQVCTWLGVCSSKKGDKQTPILNKTIKINNKYSKPKQSNCAICEYVVGAIETYIENNDTIAEIEKQLEQFCALFPSQTAACDAIVEQGVPQIVKWIEQNATPTEVCTWLGVCSSKNADKPAARLNKGIKLNKYTKPKQSNCAICEYVVTAIETYIENNATIAEIEKELEQFCALFPSQTAACDAIVEQGVPQIIKWIEQNATPTQVCTWLGVCSSKKVDKQTARLQKGIKFLNKYLKAKQSNCLVCEMVVGGIEQWIAENATIAQIEAYLDALCNDIPGLGPACTALVNQGVPEVVSWIQNNENAQQVCTQLGLCSSTIYRMRPNKPLGAKH